MAKKILISFILAYSLYGLVQSQNAGCTIDITRPSQDTIICSGDSVYLLSEGSCDVFLNNGFEGGIGVGWTSTAANPTFPDSGCPEEFKGRGGGPEGPYLWVGTNTAAERSIVTDSFDITIGNCAVKFWMRYGRQNDAGTCEDPNDANEGVHLQYSIDNGLSWTDFPGTDQFPSGPNTVTKPFETFTPGTGGYWTPTGYCPWPNSHCDERYENSTTFWWHEYDCPIPAAAETTATRFRYIQNDNQQNYDSWGLDEVKIFCSNNQSVTWSHGPTSFGTWVKPTDSTMYWVQVYDTAGNFARDTVIIYVADRPNTNLGNDTTICWDGTNAAYFDAGAGFESYLWNTGDTTQFITPDTSGTFIVEVWNVTCFDTDTINLIVIPATVSNAGSDESVCQENGWDYNASTVTPSVISADSVLWFGGIGNWNNPKALFPIYTTDPTELGDLTMGMIAYGSGPCGNDTNYMVLTVDTIPILDFTTTPVDTACMNDLITFTGTANCQITNWTWDYGDGLFGNGQISTHSFNAPGTYNIKLYVENAWNCVDTIEYTREITDPLIDFSHLPSPTCQNDSVYFEGLGDAVTYADWTWDFGDGSPTEIGRNGIRHEYVNNGTYLVSLSVCNKDTSYFHTVLETCSADAGSDEILCEHLDFDFSTAATPADTVSGDSLLWYGGLGTFNDDKLLWPVYTPDLGEIGDILMTLVVYGKAPCVNDTSTMILSILDGPEAGYIYIPDDSICVGEDIVFTDTSTTTITSWFWDLGDGNTGTGPTITHFYTAAGFYDVKLIVTNDTNCVDSVTQTVEVHPLPIAGFIISPNDSVCLNTLITFDDTTNVGTGGIVSQTWNFGDGNTAIGDIVNHTYAATGTYDVYLYILNENSCTDTMMQEVTVFALPACDFSMIPNDTNCTNEIVFFDAIDTSGTTITSWDWDFDDSFFGNGQNVSHAYTLEDDYNVMLVATNVAGCTDTSWHMRRVEEIDINFDIIPDTSCFGDLVQFQGTGDDITFTTWEWDFGDGNTDIGHFVSHTYATYDTFNITLIVCSDTIIKEHIVQEPASAFAGSDESICEDYNLQLGLITTLPTANAYDSLRWISSGDGTFNDPTLLWPVYAPGSGDIGNTIQLSLISLARIPCGNDTSTMALTVFDGPEPAFSMTPTDSICANEWVDLNATSSTTINSWNWDFGDGNTGNGQNTGYAWPVAGIYDITLMVTNMDGCQDTLIQTIEVFALPVAGFDVLPNDSICRLEELNFIDNTNPATGTLLTWFWDFGDGNTSTLQNPTHTYTAIGTYDVSMQVYNENSCRDTITQQVTIFPLPGCDFTMSPNDTNCVNEEVIFTAIDSSGTTITDWDWDFDDGGTASGQVVTHTFLGGGDFNVRLIVTNSTGCFDTVYHVRRVEDLTNLDFSQVPDTIICLGDTTWFSGNMIANFTEWFWDFGDGNTAIGPNVYHVYTIADTFDVVLSVCSETILHQHVVIDSAVVDAGTDEGICSGYTYNFINSTVLPSASSFQTLEWFTDGTGSFDDPTSLIPIYTPGVGVTGGVVTLTLVAHGITPCSNDTSSMELTITETPIAVITTTPPDSLCVDEWIVFDGSANIAISSWSWDFGDGNTATGQSVGHFYSMANPYIVELIAQGTGGCADTAMHSLEVFELPISSFSVGPMNSTCTNEELSFSGNSSTNVIEWNWDFGDGNTGTGQNINHTYSASGSYTVSLFVYNENSCRDTSTQIVTIFELPACNFSMSPNDSSCVNEPLTFMAYDTSGTTIVNWFWDFDDGSTGNGQIATHSYTMPGTYDISLIVTNSNGCLDTTIHPRVVVEPIIDFTMDLTPFSCEGYEVQFTGIGNYNFTDYIWDFGDGNSAIGKNTSHTFNLPGTYTVTLSFCTSQIQHDIIVLPLPEAFAGSDTTSCQGVPFDLSTLTLPPDTLNASNILWYGGTGSFDNPTLLGPIYTPAPAELGNIILYLVAYGNSPCYNDTSNVTINVIEGASANAGSDENSCQGDAFNFATSIIPPQSYFAVTHMWSTTGAGTIIDPTVMIPTYIPDPNELGPITFTFIASNVINCDSLDEMVLTIRPIYEYTDNQTICFGDTFYLPGGGFATTTGIYTDILQSIWGCDSVIHTDLFVRPQIDADFMVSPNDSACIGDELFFTKTGGATLISYNWDFGDGAFSNALNPSHAYPAPGVYTVTFQYTDNNGCQDEIQHNVFVYNHPNIDFNTSLSSACLNSEISFFGISPDDILTWEWDFGDGGIGFGQNVTHVYTTFGAMTITMYVTATNGCQTSISKPIFVAAPPNADFTHNIYSCDTIQFIDLSTAPDGYFIVEWDWRFGDGDSSNLQNPLHVYSTGGVYDVSLVITSDSSGLLCTDSLTRAVLVPDRPTVYFTWTPEPTCLGDITTFFGTSGNPITSWYWDFDDGNFGTVQNPEHTYTAPGVYNVMLLATDENGCWDTISHNVTVSDIPDVSFTVDPNPTCAGEQTSFAGSSTSNIMTWLWDFGDGGSSVDQNPIHVYATAGSYQVTLWVGDTANCFNQTSQWVVVNPMPLPDFTHSGITCEGDSVFFYNQSTSPNGTISQWIWDFGDGNSVTINAPNDPDIGYVYGSGGTFNVTLTVVDIDSCSNFIIKPVSIRPGPTADFNYEDNCNGQPVQFTDISTPNAGTPIVAWFWEFDDPPSGGLNTSILQNPTHLFSSSGTFDVLMVATNADGCADTVTLPVEVSMAPMVSFTTDSDSACVDGEMAFYGSASTSVTWSWDFGDGGVSVLQEPVHVYAAPGTYTVTVVVEDAGGCVGTYSDDVYINPLPISDFTFSSLPCSGSPVEFMDISSAMNSYMLEWHWYFGDGSDTVLFAPGPGDISHIYDTPGNYTVSLAIENANTCEDSIAYEVAVIQGPEAAFESSGDVCQGGTLEFTDMSQGFGSVIQGWLWSFGDPGSGSNNQSTLQNPTHVYSAVGTFFVSLTVTSNTGCQHTTIDTVDIAAPPAVDWFVNPDTTCFGDLTYFFTDVDTTIISEVTTYGWSFGDPASGINDTSNLQNPVHQYTAAGTYVVTMMIINVDGCMNTSIHEVDIKAAPIADYSYEQSCLNDSTLFFDESVSQTAVITSWLWNFGDPGSGALNTSDLQNTGHVFTDLGTYNVELITTDYFGCSDTIVKTIVVDYAPISFYKYNQPCDPPGLIYFNDSSFVQVGATPIMEWLWELEPGQYSSEINPIYTFQEYDTSYVVYLTVTDANGCENTFMDSVRVDAPLEMDFQATRVCHQDSNYFVATYMPTEDSILSWEWNFGDGNMVMGSDTMYHTYIQSGTYFVSLTIENQKGCEQTLIRQIMVDAKPAVDFVFSPSICDEPTFFSDMTDPGYGATAIGWEWNFGDIASGTNNISTLQDPYHQYLPEDSIYFVKLQVTNSFGCVDSLEKEVPKGLCMQALFEPSTPAQCNNTEVCFKDSSYIVGDDYSIQTWRWAFGDGLWEEYNQYQDSICHTYESSGSYTVQLIIFSEIDGLMFSDTTYREVMVSAVPSAALAFQSPCAEGVTKFFDISDTYNVEIISWQWDFGVEGIVTDTSSLKDPTYTYQSAGIYTIQLIVENENRCLDTTFTDMQVFNNPDAAFSSSNACAGGTTVFTDESTPAEGDLAYWLWDFGNGETSGQENPGHVYSDTGNFLVQMIVTDDNQCTDTTQNMLSVHPVPLSAFDIIDRYESIQGQILLDNLSENAIRYEWDLGNGDTSEMFTPVVRYEENGTYMIELISWNDNNCPDTAYMEYTVEFQGLYVPTGFTPDSKIPELRTFIPAGVNLEFYELTIINHRGNIVFRSNKLDKNGSPLEGWDGTVNGEPQPTGNYMWTISAKFKDGTTWNGTDVGDGNEDTFGKVVLIR